MKQFLVLVGYCTAFVLINYQDWKLATGMVLVTTAIGVWVNRKDSK